MVDVLNVFEEIAIGIRRGFYDEDVLYDSIRSIVVKLCCHAMPYIVARDTSAHENVVWLGLRWYVRMRLSDSPDDPTGSARRAWLVGEDWTRWGVHRTTLNPFSVTGAAFLLMAQLGRKLTVIDPKRDLVIRRARLSTLRGELCSVFDAALVEFKERQ